MHQDYPILYSFRRCPYAMRARLALSISRQQCILREVALRNIPAHMIALSPKATVPVLQLAGGQVIEESLDIMLWALACDDPQHWLEPEKGSLQEMKELIALNDGPFKDHLDRYKYATRYDEETDPVFHRSEGTKFLSTLNDRLEHQEHLFGNGPALADYAIFPFIRQFANTDRQWFDDQPLPNLQNWLIEHLDSKLFEDIMKKLPPWAPEDEQTLFPTLPSQTTQ